LGSFNVAASLLCIQLHICPFVGRVSAAGRSRDSAAYGVKNQKILLESISLTFSTGRRVRSADPARLRYHRRDLS
jgi:hypothetical protein